MVAIVYPEFYGVGGIARYLDSFLTNIPDGTSHRPLLITGDEHRYARIYPSADVLHLPFSLNRFNLFIWGAKVRHLLRHLHRTGRIKTVNYHWPPLIPGLFLPREIPLVLTAHTTYLGMSGKFYPARHFVSQWSDASIAIKMGMERRILAKTTHVIALTEQGRQEVRRYDYRGPITVIPNGADTERFRSDPTVAKDIDVLFSGRIELRKGSRPMVDLCKRLVSRRADIRICIVGYGDDDEHVRRELSALGANVILAGKVPFEGMIDYYNRSRVYASTSYYEGLPGTCLEAMAMQLPAVVWNFPFYAGLVVEGQTGLLAEPNDFDAMSQKILSLLDDRALAQEIGRRGRALLESNYSWRQLARDILLVLDKE